MDRIGTPSGFQSIVWTFVRHTVSRCLIFPRSRKWPRSRGQNGPIASIVNTRGFLQFLTFGSIWVVLWVLFFRSTPSTFHLDSQPFGVCFRESLVLIYYTQKSTISTLALKLSVAPLVYLWVTATVLAIPFDILRGADWKKFRTPPMNLIFSCTPPPHISFFLM